jgi:hypothetical protein
MAWAKLGSVTLGSANSNLSSGTIDANKFIFIPYYAEATSGTPDLQITFNNDTGSNYSRRRSVNGASDTTNTSQSNINPDGSLVELFGMMYIINLSSEEKLLFSFSGRADSSGASNAPNRREWVAKWANTSDQITEVDLTSSTSTLTTNSNITVIGSD